jgi:pyridoxamine 5'-phosphate oxidase
MKENLGDLRVNYDMFQLLEKDLPDNPFVLYKKWFEDAKNSSIMEPNAMTLGTLDEENKIKLRIVLLKEFNADGFVFFTNYTSDKGKQLIKNDNASLLFFWNEIHRQVRIEGNVTKISREESVTYFNSRPYESRIGALVSNQSEIIENREILDVKYKQLLEMYPENPPCPENWGGYILKPSYFEFWQGRESRLHDRIVYKFEENWKKYRLSP